jgi:hypothetical protein
MLDKIKNYLLEKGFKINSEDKETISLSINDSVAIFTIVFSEQTITFSYMFNNKKRTIADRYKIETFDEFVFLITKSMRSPIFQIT